MMSEVDVVKSTRHSAIIGRFGEYLVCNWLSRSGFEVSVVDHTGIDIVAFHPQSHRRLGITVKSRTRNPGTEMTSVNLYGANDRERILAACEAFACDPWIGVYVETAAYAEMFLLSLQHYETAYLGLRAAKMSSWGMRGTYLERYLADPEVQHIRIDFRTTNWWPTKPLEELAEQEG